MAGKRGARGDEKAARGRPPGEVVAVESWPAWRVERKPAEWFKPHPKNPRKHPVGQLKELDVSFAAHGAVTPWVCNTEGFILKGHGGMESVTHLHGRGIELPVIVVDWPEALQLEFMVRDNALAELSAWDRKAAGVVVADISKIRGVKAAELRVGLRPNLARALAPETARAGLTEPDAEAPAAPVVPASRLGDVWLLGGHRIMCGDATNADHVATLLGGARPILTVTDQPYGVDYDADWRERSGENGSDSLARGGGNRAVGEVENDQRVDWRAAWALCPGDIIYNWCASLWIPEVVASLEACRFGRRSLIIWNKNKHAISRGHYHWKHESCLYHVRDGAAGNWQGSRSETTVWDIASHGGGDAGKKDFATGHSTQKPIECMSRPMVNNSRPGDGVYDPFSGSGTTLIAAHGLDRQAFCMELKPAFVDVTIERWESFTGERARFAAGGEEWRAVAAARRGAVTAPA